MEKRTDDKGIAARGLTGLSASTSEMRTIPVCGGGGQSQMRTILIPGGRQAKGGTLARGGGYLDVCTPSKLSDRAQKKFARDPRLDTLRRMGMHHAWQKVAAEIGMDAFLAMWRILDGEEQFQHDKGGLEINLRRYRSYTKFQRNEFIRQLAATGLNPRQINAKLQDALCESVNPSHISHIIKND